MKTHIFLILIATMLSACASKEHVSQAQIERQQQEQFSYLEGQASRLR
jgi:uncharacterized protein YcfL